MRLSKVLTPEIIAGTRGDQQYISLYRSIMGEIETIDNGVKFRDSEISQMISQSVDEITGGHFAMAWKYKHTPCRVYHIGKDFSHAMANVKKDLPLDMLPERFFAYFSMPSGTFSGVEDCPVKGGFIYIGPQAETMARSEWKHERVVWINYELELGEEKESKILAAGQMPLYCANFLMPLDNGLKSAIEDAPHIPGSRKTSPEVVRAFLNLAIYIHSLNPDLLPTRAAQQNSLKQRKEFHKKFGVTNLCTLPVTFVSWNYEKPKSYSVDSTMVSAHMRWQRCGPGFSQVKLIMIDEHERRFKKGIEDAISTPG